MDAGYSLPLKYVDSYSQPVFLWMFCWHFYKYRHEIIIAKNTNMGFLENRNIFMTFISEKNYGFNLEIGLMDDISTIYALMNTFTMLIY